MVLHSNNNLSIKMLKRILDYETIDDSFDDGYSWLFRI